MDDGNGVPKGGDFGLASSIVSMSTVAAYRTCACATGVGTGSRRCRLSQLRLYPRPSLSCQSDYRLHDCAHFGFVHDSEFEVQRGSCEDAVPSALAADAFDDPRNDCPDPIEESMHQQMRWSRRGRNGSLVEATDSLS